MASITATLTLSPPSQSSLLSLRPSKAKPSFLLFHSRSPSPLGARLVAAVAAQDVSTPVIEVVVVEVESGGGGGGGLAGGGENFGGGGGGGDGNDGGGGDSEESREGDGGDEEREVPGHGLSMSQKLTLGFAALVGIGGVMGYTKSGSHKSLAAGGVSAMLLYYVYKQPPTRPVFASYLGLGVSAALLTVMGSRFKRSGKIFPSGVVTLVSLIMSAGYFHGILRSSHA